MFTLNSSIFVTDSRRRDTETTLCKWADIFVAVSPFILICRCCRTPIAEQIFLTAVELLAVIFKWEDTSATRICPSTGLCWTSLCKWAGSLVAVCPLLLISRCCRTPILTLVLLTVVEILALVFEWEDTVSSWACSSTGLRWASSSRSWISCTTCISLITDSSKGKSVLPQYSGIILS